MNRLNTPPGLLGAALLFWGWQSGLLLVGTLLAVIVEAARGVGLRWELAEKDFRRVWDFCLVLFVSVTAYLLASREGPGDAIGGPGLMTPATQARALQQTGQALLLVFRWMPMIFFLIVAAQAYGPGGKLPWSVFSPLLRRQRAGPLAGPLPAGRGLNPAYPYFAVCLLAAGIGLRPDYWFLAGLAALLAWALWDQRNRRFSAVVWAVLLALALALGFVAQRGFFSLSNLANYYAASWLAQYVGGGADPGAARTALGRIGRLKLSGRIVLRVEPRGPQPAPPLLREASYRVFRSPDWANYGPLRTFGNLSFETNRTTWEVAPSRPMTGAATISQYLTGRGEEARRGLLAVPQGIVRLENLAAFVVSTNRLGLVRVDEGPGLVIYDACFTPGSTIDGPPDHDDLAVPANEKAVLAQVASQLTLAGQTPDQVLQTVAAYFEQHFRYSSWLRPAPHSRTNLTPLAAFLTRDHAGHCEYFATAATLLLRQAGVPARYAVGYAVQEKAGRKFIVRQRHAHAWCLAWVDGAWRDFDVTPGSWFEAEAGRASSTEWLTDLFSRIRFELARLRWGLTDWRPYLLWFFAPVLAILLVRLFLGRTWKRFRLGQQRQAAPAWRPGRDSEFYALEGELAGLGFDRPPSETPLVWLTRLRDHPRLAALREPLETVVQLHYRHRFDPAGLDPAQRQALRSGAESCRMRLRARPIMREKMDRMGSAEAE